MPRSLEHPTLRELGGRLAHPALALVVGAVAFGVGLTAAWPCVRESPSPCSAALQWGIFVVIVAGTAALTIALAWGILLVAGWVTDRRDTAT